MKSSVDLTIGRLDGEMANGIGLIGILTLTLTDNWLFNIKW